MLFWVIISGFLVLNSSIDRVLPFSSFKMPSQRSAINQNASASMEHRDDDVQTRAEPRIDPVIQATSHRRQTTAIRGGGRPLSDFQHGRIFTYLSLDWTPQTIATKLGISTRTVQKIENNLQIYSSTRRPQLHTRGRRKRMTLADEDTILQYLLSFS